MPEIAAPAAAKPSRLGLLGTNGGGRGQVDQVRPLEKMAATAANMTMGEEMAEMGKGEMKEDGRSASKKLAAGVLGTPGHPVIRRNGGDDGPIHLQSMVCNGSHDHGGA